MTPNMIRRFALLLVVASPVLVFAQRTPTASSPAAAPDMIDRIFATREFSPRPAPSPQWFDGGASYLLVRQNDIYVEDIASGATSRAPRVEDAPLTLLSMTPVSRGSQRRLGTVMA
jgi:hypothetical protein